MRSGFLTSRFQNFRSEVVETINFQETEGVRNPESSRLGMGTRNPEHIQSSQLFLLMQPNMRFVFSPSTTPLSWALGVLSKPIFRSYLSSHPALKFAHNHQQKSAKTIQFLWPFSWDFRTSQRKRPRGWCLLLPLRLAASKSGPSDMGLMPLSVVSAESCAIAHICDLFVHKCERNFRCKMTTIIGNRGQLRTGTLSPHVQSSDLDSPEKCSRWRPPPSSVDFGWPKSKRKVSSGGVLFALTPSTPLHAHKERYGCRSISSLPCCSCEKAWPPPQCPNLPVGISLSRTHGLQKKWQRISC